MEKQGLKNRAVIIAMKGHPGTGKSTIAQHIATRLKCPLIDKDHFKDSTTPLQESLSSSNIPAATAKQLLNDLSYDVMFRVASTQLGLGLSVVIDSPLSRRSHLDRLLEMGRCLEARVVAVECRPGDEAEWRRRVEHRGKAEGSSWHKPSTWEEMERLLQGYRGCWDYDVGEVPKLVVDTTAPVTIDDMVSTVLEFLRTYLYDQNINDA